MLTPISLRFASKVFLQLAKDTEAKMLLEQDAEKKTALRMVAGQCYFYSEGAKYSNKEMRLHYPAEAIQIFDNKSPQLYAGIEAIESVLLKTGISVEDHKDRIRKVELNYRLFKNPNDILTKHKILTQEGLNYRRRVAYRGENGNKFIALKEFAEVARREIE